MITIKSTISNQELMSQARASLRGHWKKPVLATLVFFALAIGFDILSSYTSLGVLLIFGPLQVAWAAFYLVAVRQQRFCFKELGKGVKQFFPALFTYWLMALFIFLWALLLIVPGLIALFSYALVPYILCDQPELTAVETLKRSKLLMRGNRWKFFCLLCRFAGWLILAALSLGIGYIWLVPYMNVSAVCFYEDLLRNEHSQQQIASMPVTAA